MPQREVHLRDYLAILRKHDFIISLSFLLILGTAVIVSLRLPKTYAASTLILLIQPTSSPPVSSTSLFQSVLSGGVDRTEMETIGQRFSTESMLASAIAKLENAGVEGVRYLPSIGRLKQNLRAKTRPDTHYIELSLRLNAEEGGERNAALLTNQLISEMQALRSREERTKADRRRQLLDAKLSELLQQIKQQEDAALQFASKNGSPALWYPQLASLLDERAKFVEQQAQIEWGMKATQLESNFLQKEIEKYPEHIKLSETTSHHPIWLYQTEKLLDLESQRVGLKQRVGANSSEIMALDAQIKEIRNELAKNAADQAVTSITHGPSSLYMGIQDRLINLQTTILRAENNLNQIQLQFAQVDAELKQLIAKIPENELALEKLRRNIDATHELRKEIYKQNLEAEILLAESDYERMESSHRRIKGGIEIVDPATPRKIPVSPRIQFIIVVSGIIGGAVGIFIAFIWEYFGNTYTQPEAIQSELGLFHLGSVARHKGMDGLAQPLPDVYRTIAAHIDLSHPETEKQILMLTSCNVSEDVSMITANLAVTMASVRDAVLIVDCNLSNPVQHQIFNIPLDTRLTHLLADESMDWHDAIQQTHIPNLHLLSAGALSSNPIDLLRLPRLNALFQQLREHYTLILLDAPPVLPTADSQILSVYSDAVVLVADLAHTTREALRTSRDRMVHTRTPLLGFIETYSP